MPDLPVSDPSSPARTTAPYGSWTSPITPALLVEKSVGLSSAGVAGDRVYWVEARPSEAGRQVLMAAALDGSGPVVEVTPPEFSVRTQVHEYGGRCHAVGAGMVVFSNWADQRLWLLRPNDDPIPLTSEPEMARSVRFADPVIDPDGRWVVCVRERHFPDGDVSNDIVAIAVDGDSEPVVLAQGHDFYGSPRISPDGRRLAWVTWDHPSMPWDSTELWSAEIIPGIALGNPERIAGGPDESVTQPRWSPGGRLHYASDRSGWWNIYDEAGRAVAERDAEFADPDWAFGNTSYGFDPGGDLVASWTSPQGRRLGVLRHDGDRYANEFVEMEFPFSSYSSISPFEGGAVAIAASPTIAPAVVRLDWSDRAAQVIQRSREVPIGEADVSRPEAITFPTAGGEDAHALFYAPANASFEGPDGELPPVMVVIHGGPTSSSSAVFNLAVQFWTNRGIAVADVDYRGSSGYGREYRKKLDGTWGISDVEDCAAVVSWLAEQGRVDGRRAVIRGGSAGGFTTLAALAFTDAFAAGASHYGVADLELLARDTHKFESRYLDTLVGPWPADAEVYQRRSPIHHVEMITSPLIIFQGLEDMIVPPAQAQLMYDALAGRGVPVAYLAFEGEQHGFRQAATVMAVMRAELEFYGLVLGFDPDLPEGPPLQVTNVEALSPRS